MRVRAFLSVAAVGVALAGAALGQQAAVTTQPKSVSGLSLAFDAPHGQLTASGYSLKPRPLVVPGETTFTGTVNMTITVNIVSTFRRGTRISCGGILIGGEIDTSVPVVDGGIETAGGDATVNWMTKTATCTLTIPYEWSLATDASASQGLIIGFAAAAVGHDRDSDTTQRSTIQIGGPIPLPATGTTTTLAFTTTL